MVQTGNSPRTFAESENKILWCLLCFEFNESYRVVLCALSSFELFFVVDI